MSIQGRIGGIAVTAAIVSGVGLLGVSLGQTAGLDAHLQAAARAAQVEQHHDCPVRSFDDGPEI